MKRMKTKLFIILSICTLFLTGCKTDDMDGIEVAVTNYPNEYIVKELYGNHSSIESVYPDGVDLTSFKISQKQKNKYSKSGLFVYNGLVDKERKLAVNLLDINQDLKIIDSAYVLETEYAPEELWLNPSSMLMMAQNVRTGLKEYVTNTYLRDDIDSKYNDLKIKLSELDANYRIAVENTENKTIVVSNSTLKFLEKFGLDVLVVDENINEKTLGQIENLIEDGTISYIYTFKGEKLNDNTNQILKNYPDLKRVKLHKLDNISDSDRNNKKDYISIMKNNLELIKQELYQ